MGSGMDVLEIVVGGAELGQLYLAIVAWLTARRTDRRMDSAVLRVDSASGSVHLDGSTVVSQADFVRALEDA